MSTHAEAAPRSTELYSTLTFEQQAEFSKLLTNKLKILIGGYGELSVLAEYIAVMLQSSKPADQVQVELEAFLQDQSGPFTTWLCDTLAKFAGEGGPAIQADASRGEALLMRAVRDARHGADRGEGDAGNDAGKDAGKDAGRDAARDAGKDMGKRREKGERERRSSRHTEKRAVAAGAAAAAPTEPAERAERAERVPTLKRRSENHRSRSRSRQRSRPRRRHRGLADAGAASKRKAEASRRDEALREEPQEVPKDTGADSPETAERKAVLTPNVQFLRDAYHQKTLSDKADEAPPGQDPKGGSAPPDTHWHFRAEPLASAPAYMASPVTPLSTAPPVHPAFGPPPRVHYRLPDGPPGVAVHVPELMVPPAQALPPPSPQRQHYPPKKWRVVRADVKVRATERLDSQEVQTLQEGAIVEQVAAPFKLQNGIIRIQIRHPSSPEFPNPIGWVTQDATAAGGPKFLEPGPEAMSQGWRPRASPGSWWRPRGPPSASRGPTGARLPAPRGRYGFQNLTWKSSGADEGRGADEGEAAPGSG